MGKHDKEIDFNWDDGSDESYTVAENRRLLAENERLKTTIRGLKREASRQEKIYEKVVDGAKRAIAQKDKEIAFWKYKAMKLVEKHV